jgi:hypothetical protein
LPSTLISRESFKIIFKIASPMHPIQGIQKFQKVFKFGEAD